MPAARAKASKTKAQPRPRNAAATREAILASARKAFVKSGYDGAGVREIAGGAGVTAMLVNRYFGSKEQLFAEVVAGVMSEPLVLTKELLDAPDAGTRMARGVVIQTSTDATPLDGFLIMLRSASSGRAAEIGRQEIEKHYHKRVTAVLEGEHAAQRAAMMLAVVAGFQVMRQMIGLKALAKADADTLVAVLAPLFTQLFRPAPV